ncbi:MAG: hypothetical protein ACON4E_04420 [Flavobacteriales bacterium]
MKNLILTLIITLPLTLWGQEWTKTFGGLGEEYGSSVQQTTDGGFIITGRTNSFGFSNDVYLIKTYENGVEQWSKTFGESENDNGNFVQQTTDGGFIIIGNTNSFSINNGSEIWLIKTDENGEEQWNQTFGGVEQDYGKSVQQTIDGGFIIIGQTESFGNGGRDVYLIKTDENGIEQWNQTFGGLDNDFGESVQQTNDGGYIIIGSTGSFGNSVSNIWLIKTDNIGNELWSKTYGGTENISGYSVQQTTDGGFILTGSTNSVLSENGTEIWLIKTDINGIEQWNQTFGGLDNDFGYSVKQTNDGGYIITGQTWSFGNGESDVFLIKTDEDGEEQWFQTFGGTEIDRSISVQQTNDSGYIITGQTWSFGNGESDIYLIKTDDQGNITSTIEIPLPNPNRKLEKTINLKGQEINPKTNTPVIEIFDDGSVEKKIIVE